MKTKAFALYLLLSVGLLSTACSSRKKPSRASIIQKHWVIQASRSPHSIAESCPESTGLDCIKVTLKSRDFCVSKKGEKTHRAEIIAQDNIKNGDYYEYDYDLYLPQKTPRELINVTLSEWWQKPDNSYYSKQSPMFAIVYENGTLFGEVMYEKESKSREMMVKKIFIIDDFELGKWHNINIKMKTGYENGSIYVTINKKCTAKYSGKLGYNQKNPAIFKFGIYMDDTRNDYIAYFGNVRIGK